jgi:hypothetical protein
LNNLLLIYYVKLVSSRVISSSISSRLCRPMGFDSDHSGHPPPTTEILATCLPTLLIIYQYCKFHSESRIATASIVRALTTVRVVEFHCVFDAGAIMTWNRYTNYGRSLRCTGQTQQRVYRERAVTIQPFMSLPQSQWLHNDSRSRFSS